LDDLALYGKFGWENVRGWDFLVVEGFKLQERIAHIYDCTQNRIRYFVLDSPYLSAPLANGMSMCWSWSMIAII
jgi:hypothetical protein